MAAHVMTARRRAALRKAQLASARKRKGRRRITKKRVAQAGVLAAIGGLAVARHQVTGSRFYFRYKKGPKGWDSRHMPFPEYLGHNKITGESITRPSKKFKRASFVYDEYYPGVMRGIMLRSGRRLATLQYTHVKTYGDRYMHATARKDKAYTKAQQRNDRKLKKIVKNF